MGSAAALKCNGSGFAGRVPRQRLCALEGGLVCERTVVYNGKKFIVWESVDWRCRFFKIY